MPRVTLPPSAGGRRLIRPIVSVALLIALMGCGQGFGQKRLGRDRSEPIYSTADFPIARMMGAWQQVAGFGPALPCTSAPNLTLTASAGAVLAQYDLCLPNARAVGAGALASAGAQGRYFLPNLQAPIWILWMDASDQTMVIGTPDGSFAMVLAKSPPPSDHLRAAREILTWNGYDLTQFHQY